MNILSVCHIKGGDKLNMKRSMSIRGFYEPRKVRKLTEGLW